ncbi:MAG: hypothetical protein AB1772_12885, partial [Candidatus Zixiibacteriota bacterium]
MASSSCVWNKLHLPAGSDKYTSARRVGLSLRESKGKQILLAANRDVQRLGHVLDTVAPGIPLAVTG